MNCYWHQYLPGCAKPNIVLASDTIDYMVIWIIEHDNTPVKLLTEVYSHAL